jgi:hydrogenase expression/formation protein HypE
MFLPRLGNPVLDQLLDAAVFSVGETSIAFTTDSYVVKPPFFPGGDIGALAVYGTVNDLSMVGARPLYLSCGFILEENLEMAVLEEIVASMQAAAERAGVQIVAGDTKVVERGGADGLFINTAGIGAVPEGVEISTANALEGDKVLVSGTMGDHGVAVLCRREGIELESSLESDLAPLNSLVAQVLEATPRVHCLRDPTRGGLASALNEIAGQSSVGIAVDEEELPVKPAVRGACELLGLDPLYIANEGKLVAMVAPEDAERALEAMRSHPDGRDAAIIGDVASEPKGTVMLRTLAGGTRIVHLLTDEQLPRIC